MKSVKVSVFMVVMASVLAMSGCATKADISSLREDIAALALTSNDALENSRQAKDMATKSTRDLDIIRRDLAEARKRAELNREKLDSVFEKSMKK